MKRELGFETIPFEVNPELESELFGELERGGRRPTGGGGFRPGPGSSSGPSYRSGSASPAKGYRSGSGHGGGGKWGAPGTRPGGQGAWGGQGARQGAPQKGTHKYPQGPRKGPPGYWKRPWQAVRSPYAVIEEPLPLAVGAAPDSERVRWVQDCLNNIMNLQLPVNGIMGPETRSAVRSFQQQQGLQPSGILSPNTEQALSAACEAPPSPPPPEELESFWETTPYGEAEGFGFDPESEFPGGYRSEDGELKSQNSYRNPPPARRNAAAMGRRYPPFSLEPFLLRALGGSRSRQELEFFGGFSEQEGELTGARLAAAVAGNRRLARQLGWGCVVNDVLQLNETPRPKIYDLLGLGAKPSEEDFAQAVEKFQQKELGAAGADGQLGAQTLNRLRQQGAFPANKFAPFSKPISFGGKQLGVLEKTRAYEKCFFDPVNGAPCRAARSGIAGEGAGALIELGFRVTDIDAVRRAGFVDGYGEPFFRWIQVVDFITVPVFNAAGAFTGFVRRASGEIDPTAVVGIPPGQLDLSPYYWDEVTLGGASPGLNIDQWVHKRGQNGLCYDLIFQDRATFPLSTVSPPAPWTKPGSHAYFNFELALVGVRPGLQIQNFVLHTVRWGYDIFMKGGQPSVDLNGLNSGATAGSPNFKKIMNREFNRDDVPFPAHCMAGSGYTGLAVCKK